MSARAAACAAALTLGLAGCAQRPEVACGDTVDRAALNQCAGLSAGLAQFASAMDAPPDTQRRLSARADALAVAARSCATGDSLRGGAVLARDQTLQLVAHDREIARIRSLYQQSLRDQYGSFDRGLVPAAAFSPPELTGCDVFVID